MTDVIYRPPMWSQRGEYSAADDRRLIHATFFPGVIDFGDLAVIPRPAAKGGPNMSVEVAPGECVVTGTSQDRQGKYLCPLNEPVNVPIPPGAAGVHRREYIYAKVYEPPEVPPGGWLLEPDPDSGEQQAEWRIVRQETATVSTSQPVPAMGVGGSPPHPKSALLLAIIGPILNNTTQITGANAQIVDMRHLARPGSTGNSLTWLAPGWRPSVAGNQQERPAIRQDNPGTPAPGQPDQYLPVPGAEHTIFFPPEWSPIDVEVVAEGLVGGGNNISWWGECWFRIYLETGSFGPHQYGANAQGIRTYFTNDHRMRYSQPWEQRALHLTLLVPGLVLLWPAKLHAWLSAQNRSTGFSMRGRQATRLEDCRFLIRISPGGSHLEWGQSHIR